MAQAALTELAQSLEKAKRTMSVCRHFKCHSLIFNHKPFQDHCSKMYWGTFLLHGLDETGFHYLKFIKSSPLNKF